MWQTLVVWYKTKPNKLPVCSHVSRTMEAVAATKSVSMLYVTVTTLLVRITVLHNRNVLIWMVCKFVTCIHVLCYKSMISVKDFFLFFFWFTCTNFCVFSIKQTYHLHAPLDGSTKLAGQTVLQLVSMFLLNIMWPVQQFVGSAASVHGDWWCTGTDVLIQKSASSS